MGTLLRKYGAQLVYYPLILYFTYLMVLITLQYIPIDFSAAFLRIKRDEILLRHYQIAFFSHVYTGIFVLITGIFQFSTTLRQNRSGLHRTLGKIYIFFILLVAAPSGLIMGYYANGGLIGQVSFSVLSILWFGFTYLAYRYARQKKWDLHRNFMLRSYALTLSAISLRLFKWLLASAIELPPMDMYKIIAVAGWIVNLIVVEVYIYSRYSKV